MSTQKEPHYFSQSIKPSQLSRPIRDKTKYLGLFKNVKQEIAIGEASASYLRDPKAPQLIHETVPNSKIIIILRDPVERAFSNYVQRVGGGKTYSFSEAIQEALESKDDYYKKVIIDGGRYFEQVERYLNIFGSENVKIIIFEEFIKNPRKIIREILEFLDVDEEPPESLNLLHNVPTKPRGKLAAVLLGNKKLKKLGKSVLSESAAMTVVKHVLGENITKPKMSQEDRTFLEDLYRNDANNLQKLLGKNLPWSFLQKENT